MVTNSTITNKGKNHLSSQQIEDQRDHGIWTYEKIITSNLKSLNTKKMEMQILSWKGHIWHGGVKQRRSSIYAVTPWRAHRQVKKKCIVNFNSIINISLIRRTSYFCMVVMWWTSRADALYTFKTLISSCVR